MTSDRTTGSDPRTPKQLTSQTLTKQVTCTGHDSHVMRHVNGTSARPSPPEHCR